MDTGKCNYHQCGKEAEIFECEYCHRFYCKEHLHAKPLGPPRFDGTTPEDKRFMQEWHKPGHPCFPYLAYWEAEQEREKQRYRDALDKLKLKPLKSATQDYIPYSEPKKSKPESLSRPRMPRFNTPSMNRILKYLIMSYIIFNYLVLTGLISDLKLQKLSLLPPRNETEIEKIIFQLTNEERVKASVSPLRYNSNLVRIAKEHSKDMIKNNYLRHNYDVNLGENIGQVPITFIPFFIHVEGCGILTLTNDQIAFCHVKGWINSPRHYENMIRSSYSEMGIGVSCSFFECKATQNFR